MTRPALSALLPAVSLFLTQATPTAWMARQPWRRSRSVGVPSATAIRLASSSSGTTPSNDFYALRHGQSLANVAGIIASDPAVACHQYGLSETGRAQAAAAGQTVVQQAAGRPVVLLTSDLLRAQETACIVRDVLLDKSNMTLYQDDVIVETRLRERWFGAWDGTSDQNYHNVWEQDALDASHTVKGVESVQSVMERATACVREWDEALLQTDGPSYMVVCVAHGDVLQILQAALEGVDGKLHRSLPHLETAQLRRLTMSKD